MIVRQFFIPGIAHSSYIVAGNRACAIIDPSRDVGRYIRAARGMHVKITHILETHLHADFISGHLDLADATGAEIHAPRSAGCAFPHAPLSEGDEVVLEDMRLSVIETAGHTPEHICYVAADTSRGETPVALFSGDTLFVNDVGRPDLFPGRAEELAGRLYDNLHNKVLALPDECELYPAHGMGSLCGRAMAAKRSSTIGYERKYNYALSIRGRKEFIHALTSGMPAAPDHFARCSEINRAGPALMRDLAAPAPLGPGQFAEKTGGKGAVLLDVRDYPGFSGVHIPGSWNIDLAGNFATNAGWVIPPEKEIFLVTEDERQAKEAALQLRRVGFDRIPGYLDGGMLEWGMAGLLTSNVPVITAAEADARARAGTAVLVDVRTKEEWEHAHAETSIHIPWHEIRTRYTGLNPARPHIVMCKGGQRASIAASILLMHGFLSVSNIAGGYDAMQKGGFAP